MSPLAGIAAPARDRTPAMTSKPTPPISVSHRIVLPPKVGQPVEVLLSIAANGEMTATDLSFSVDDPLAMIDPIGGLSLGTVAPGEGADVAVTVLPLLDQTHYLGITVRAVIDGIEQTRSISVPIRLSGSELRKAEVEPAGNDGERVRSFEAIETVR
jgi:hypothetical protein